MLVLIYQHFMYLSGGNATVNASLSPVRKEVIWLARLGSPRYIRRNSAKWVEFKSYFVITRETLAHKTIFDHLTRIVIVDEIINANTSKAPQRAQNSC